MIDTCEELDHLDEQVMQYLNITLREKDTQVIPFCADGTYWVPVEAGEAKDVRAEKWMEYYQCDQERFWKFQRYFYEWTGEIPKRLELSVKPEKRGTKERLLQSKRGLSIRKWKSCIR